MVVGTARQEPGQITRGHVELGSYPDGPLTSPVMIASGAKKGPTLWLQSCIHGPEVVGPLSIQRFLKTVDLTEMSGTVICLMLANPLGFRGYNRLTPQDGFNLNRVFPGDPAGHHSQQLAHRLLELSLEHSDAMLDLHSGGDLTITCHYTLFHNDGTAAGVESERLARATGTPNVWNSLEPFLGGAHFANYTKRGKPSLIVESGGGARVTAEDLDRLTGAIFGMCKAMNILPGEPPKLDRIRLGGDAVHLKCTRGGLFIPRVGPGDDVTKGQHLADLVDLFGDVVQEIHCPLEKAWVGSVRRPHMPIYNGDQVFELVETKGYEPA
jgi:predicted deacylase